MVKHTLLLFTIACFLFHEAAAQVMQKNKTAVSQTLGNNLVLAEDQIKIASDQQIPEKEIEYVEHSAAVHDLQGTMQRWKNESHDKRSTLYWDTLTNIHKQIFQTPTNASYKLRYSNFIVPTLFIGLGVASLSSDGLKKLNSSTKDEIAEHKLSHLTLDNYSQYVPALMVYGLNVFGVKGKHNFRDRTVIYLTSQLISGAMVIPLKHLVKEVRPDSSNALSFPSGHTATAFSSAQFMYHEYYDSNFWLSISGYPFAVFTGIYRTINNRHWVGDVVAGAGFGILSTELAYWLHPKINQLLFKNKPNSSSMVMPFYQNRQFGVSYARQF